MAAALGLPTEQVGRVTLFQARDRLVAVVVPARAEPDPEAAARTIRRRSLSPVASDRATEITDFLPQAMPPAGLPDGTALILDEGLSQQEVLYFPGGETSTMLKIRPADLIRATDAVVAAVTR
jgi:Cys-tRNA(Pro)/Cys-tRNA(Cys) deacylase